MRTIKYLPILTLLILLSSCGLYSQFNAPEISDTNLMGEGFTLREEPIDSIKSWKELFTDPKLVELINQALSNNSDLKIAQLNITQANRSLSTARLAYIPSVAFAGEGSVTQFGSVTTRSYTLPLTASWEVDLFGRLTNKKHQNEAVVKQTKIYKNALQSQLIAAVATNYYALILADNQLAVAKQNLETVKQSLKTIEALKKIGAQNQASVEQYKANVKAVEITVEALSQSVQLTSNNLNLLLSRSPEKIERASEINIANINLENSIALTTLSSRPDVLLSEAVLCQSFYGVNYARSSLYPSIKITGVAGYSLGEMLLSAIGSVTQPIFMANANRAALENAKEQYEQNLLSFHQTLVTAGKEANDALMSIKTAEQTHSLLQERVSHLERAVEITSKLMNAGKANYLEVLVAQNSYLAASIELQTAKYNQAVSQITLYTVLGGGAK